MNFGPPPTDHLLPSCIPNLNWDQPMDLSQDISSFFNGHVSSLHPNRLMLFSGEPPSFSSFDAGGLVRVSSSKVEESSNQSRSQSEIGEGEFGSGQEDSSVTNPVSFSGNGKAKKRKAASCRIKVKAGEENGVKKCKVEEKAKKNGRANGLTAIDPPTDYIHVRARRGQATDSHSLAERVRREKISQRMKLLQDLVPGCNKITGKSLMLDEIINYVQSLQRQVEFLSMKLTTMNPRLDFGFDDLISKGFLTSHGKTSLLNSLHYVNNIPSVLSFGHQSKEGGHFPLSMANVIENNCQMSRCEPILYEDSSLESSLDMFGGAASQMGSLLDDVLHNDLQTGLGKNLPRGEIGVTSNAFNGQLPTTQMKIEF